MTRGPLRGTVRHLRASAMTSRIARTLPLLIALAGCGPARPARVVPPALDPEAVAAAVLAKADANGDGRIVKAELPAVPALVTAVAALDADGDGAISAVELGQWLTDVKESRIAITSCSGRVTHLKKPLAGATVTLVPEPFMGPGYRAAGGVTDADGAFAASIPEAKYPGVNCGLFRVEITGQGNDGKPLPARYNTETTLGLAVGGRLPEDGSAIFTLE